MKFLSSFALLLITSFSMAQTPSVNWGEPLKVKKGSTDLDIIHVDKTGIYLQESHAALRTYFVLGATTRESGTLIKLDKNLDEVYKNSFDKELKGKNFENLLFANGKMFLFATSVQKAKSLLELYGVELDKATGTQKGEWTKLISLQNEKGVSNLQFSIHPNPDSTAIAIATGIEYSDRADFGITLVNDKLQIVGKTLSVSYPISPKEFVLENMVYAPNGNVLVVNRLMEYREGKKKKDKFLDFKEYDIRLFGADGNLIKQVSVGGNDSRHITQSRVVLRKDGNFTLGAFYSKQKRGAINGLLFVTINGSSGEIMNEGAQEISNAMLVAAPDDEDDDGDDSESRAERKERKRLEKLNEDDDNIASTFKIRNILPLDNGSFLLLAEKYHTYTVVSTSGGGSSGMMNTQTRTYSVHGNLLFVKVSNDNKVEWLQMLPKNQVSQIDSRTSSSGASVSYFNYRIPATYGSVGTMLHPTKGTIYIFFNDNPRNATVTNAGSKAKTMQNVRKTDCFMLEVDPATGNYKRKVLFSNDDIPDAMPAMGSQIGNAYYMVGKKKERTGFGKARVAIGKITVR